MKHVRSMTWVGGLAVLAIAAGCSSSSERAADWPGSDQPERPPPAAEKTAADEVVMDGEAGRLREPTREAVAIDGSELVRGRSQVIVEAPIELVRKTVLDYRHYSEFMPYYKTARVLRRLPDGGREVYMQWVALHGVVKLWARLEMSAARMIEGVETHQSRFVDGNVHEAVAIWRLTPVTSKRTELSLEVFLHPKMPMPVRLLNEENLDAAVKGVSAMRERCESEAP